MPSGKANPSAAGDKKNKEYLEALERLERAQERMLSSAIAFCDGVISAGQLRAVREFLREQERKFDELGGLQASPFLADLPAEPEPGQPGPEAGTPEPAKREIQPPRAATQASAIAQPGIAPDPMLNNSQLKDIDDPELKQRLEVLDHKIARLEQDFQQGRINASQYRAIYRHYMEQREVALRLRQKYPDSDRWQVVLEEGKTRFLLQLNEATCYSIGLYDIESRDRIFVHGDMPAGAEEAMALLGTFGGREDGTADGRLFATKTESGETLLLIPGAFTLNLAVFSQDPPAWQVRALREVHRNFEAANRAALQRGETEKLIFPDLNRFVKP
ncbi:MAG: hypothetical protein P1P76_11145 [Anaerolineales bacterium]|nr:hypothetical protein [Anaerolineales bacterium]